MCLSVSLSILFLLHGVANVVVESRGAIMLRPSQLDPDVPISVHPAPDVLSFRVVRVDVRIAAMHLSFRTGRAPFGASGSRCS